MASDRKLVTVLFADIVGSTEHVGEHDPELVRETLATTFGRVRTVVEQYGGIVEKFVGDAAFAVFGVPHVHEDDADRAVRTAFALRGAIGELNQTGAFPLEVRIGINTGEVVAG